jgi:hypothetical protein
MKRALACVVVASVFAACGDGSPFEGTVWQSSRVRYHARHDDPAACSQVLATLDTVSDRFSTIVGRPASSWEPYDYYKFLDDEDYARVQASAGFCASLPSIACQQGRSVFSPHPADYHELAHVYYTGLVAAGPRFLTEGFAIALTCVSSYGPYFAPDLPVEAALDPDGPHGPSPAARLTTALWFSGTPQQFYDLHAGLGAGVPARDAVSAAVSRVYSRDLDALWLDARSKAGLECVAYPFCDAPLLRLDETVTLAETCTGVQAVRLSAAAAPAVAIRVAGAPLAVAACDPTAAPDPIRRVEIRPREPTPWRFEHWIRVPATAHALFPSPADATLGDSAVVEARAIGTAFSATCDAGTPAELAADRAVRIVLPYEAGVTHFPLRSSSPTALTITLRGYGGTNPRRVRWCSGGCPADAGAACADLDAVAGADVQASGDAILVVEAASETDDLLILELAPDPGAAALP